MPAGHGHWSVGGLFLTCLCHGDVASVTHAGEYECGADVKHGIGRVE